MQSNPQQRDFAQQGVQGGGFQQAPGGGAPVGNYGQANVGHHHHHHPQGGPRNVGGNTIGTRTGQQQMPGTFSGPGGYAQNGAGGQGMDGAGTGYQLGGPKTTVQAAEAETSGRGAGQYRPNDFANGQGTTGGVHAQQGQFPATQASNTTAGHGGMNHGGLATGAAAAGTGAALGARHGAGHTGTTTGTGTGTGVTAGGGPLNATHDHGTSKISEANSEHRRTAQTIGGKLQQAAGMVLSSDKMKAEGLAREHGAKANNDVNEAQRLEQGAAAHREAAVMQGAQPNQKNLGGGL